MSNQLGMWTNQYHEYTVIAYSAEDAQIVLSEYYKTVIGEDEPVPDDNVWQKLYSNDKKTVIPDYTQFYNGDYVRETKTVAEWLETSERGYFSSVDW